MKMYRMSGNQKPEAVTEEKEFATLNRFQIFRCYQEHPEIGQLSIFSKCKDISTGWVRESLQTTRSLTIACI